MDVREKLVERLREVAGLTPPICEYQEQKEIELFGKKVTVYCKPFEQFQELLREAADYIDNGVMVQDWISVEDRLPDVEGKYLVCIANGRVHIDYFIDDYCNGHPAFGRYAVTHWMPFPEPPKGE